MATPMSASCRAGPSLTPSPVIATTWPRACRARAMRSLSSGETRATTMPSWSSDGSEHAGRRLAARARENGDVRRGAARPPSAIAAAVAGWSPVTIATLIRRGGRRPVAIRPPSRGGSSRRHQPEQAQVALAPPRGRSVPCRSPGRPRPRAPGDPARSSAPRRAAPRPHGGHRTAGRTLSGAPLTTTALVDDDRHAPASGDRRGTELRHMVRAASASVSTPSRRAKTSSAASIGSPWARHGRRLGDIPGRASHRRERQVPIAALAHGR